MDLTKMLASAVLVCGGAATIRGTIRAVLRPAVRRRAYAEICMGMGLTLWGLQALAPTAGASDALRIAGMLVLLAGAGWLRLVLSRPAPPAPFSS